MPNCLQCSYLNKQDCKCTAPIFKKRSGKTRQCDMAVELKTAKNVYGAVLEIGFGKNRTFRRKVLRKRDGTTWTGVEPRWESVPLSNEYNGSASSLPFNPDSFNFVVSFQSVEHWEEFNSDMTASLAEIYRVLKPGGSFIATIPIHSHGSDMFVLGNVQEFLSCFGEKWSKIETEDWRRDWFPLEPSYPSEKRISVLRKIRPLPEVINDWMLEVIAEK